MPTPHHPCGSLPVTGIALSAWYCHHHQAWFAMASAYIEESGDVIRPLRHREREFGPFDNEADMQQWMVKQLLLMAGSHTPPVDHGEPATL